MRFLSLGLVAYGPFDDCHIHFGEPGLHVLYGLNETGKSSARRAVENFLYGIPRHCPDAHLHDPKSLCIEAELELGSGRRVSWKRRAGAARSLVDECENPVEEEAQRKALSGHDRESFKLLFGLNHESLRAGASALLDAAGAGEGLYVTAAGRAPVQRVLRELRAESGLLFKYKARTKPLIQVALNEVAAAKALVSPTRRDSWVAQEQGLVEARGAQRDLEAELSSLRQEERRLRRAIGVGRILERRRRLKEERDALGSLPRLPQDFAEQWRKAERRRGDLDAERRGVQSEMLQLEQELARLNTDPEGLRLSMGELHELHQELGRYRALREQEPDLRGGVVRLSEEVSRNLRQLGSPLALPPDGLRFAEPAALSAVRAWVKQRSQEEDALRRARRDLARRAGDCASHAEALGAQGDVKDVSLLKSLLDRASLHGPSEHEALRREVADSTERSAQLAAELGSDDLATLSRHSPPMPESVRRFEDELSELVEREKRLQESLEDSVRERAKAESDLSALEGSGAVPSESDLMAARATRDGLVKRLSDVHDSAAGPSATERTGAWGALMDAIQQSDGVADRLRREGERVSAQARLLADIARYTQTAGRVTEQLAAVARKRQDWDVRWAALCRPFNVLGNTPREMFGTIEKWEAFILCYREQLRLLRRLAEAKEELAKLSAALLDELEELGESAPAGSDWSTQIFIANECVSRELRGADKRLAAEATARHLEAERKKAEAALQLCSAEVRASKDRGQELLDRLFGPLQVGEALVRQMLESSDTAATQLGCLETLASAFGALSRAQAELSRHEAQRRELEGRVERAAAKAGQVASAEDADLGALALDLFERGTAAWAARQAADAMSERRAQAEQRSLALGAAALSVNEQLDSMLNAAGAKSVEELSSIEARVRDGARMDAELRALGDELRRTDAGGTGSLDLAEPGADWAASEERLDSIADERDELEIRHRSTVKRILELEAGLQDFERSETADRALAAEQAVARLPELVERYARARLAEKILEREFERHRRETQGPVLNRASQWFERVTGGSFSAIRVHGAGSEEALVGLRPGGESVALSGMSSGVLDQFYLSLRIASLEEHFRGHPPVPIILDDVFAHFDHARAPAALEALRELAQTTQVLFFTHDSRIRDLALTLEQTSGSGVSVHELTRKGGVTRSAVRVSQAAVTRTAHNDAAGH